MKHFASAVAIENGFDVLTAHICPRNSETKVLRGDADRGESAVFVGLFRDVHGFLGASNNFQLVANAVRFVVFRFHNNGLRRRALIEHGAAIRAASGRRLVPEVNITLTAILSAFGLRNIALSAGDGRKCAKSDDGDEERYEHRRHDFGPMTSPPSQLYPSSYSKALSR